MLLSLSAIEGAYRGPTGPDRQELCGKLLRQGRILSSREARQTAYGGNPRVRRFPTSRVNRYHCAEDRHLHELHRDCVADLYLVVLALSDRRREHDCGPAVRPRVERPTGTH